MALTPVKDAVGSPKISLRVLAIVCLSAASHSNGQAAAAAASVACLLASGCPAPISQSAPTIQFTRLPPAGEGSSAILNPIEGRVIGARPGQRVVLFARSGAWWVQPLANRPFTAVQADSKWKNNTHPGSAYAALLVDSSYRPSTTLNALPPIGGPIHAVVTADGSSLNRPVPKMLYFGGYEWAIRQSPGSPGGSFNRYKAENAWVDEQGRLHLRISRDASGWSSAEVRLSRSLGYGSYHFVVRDISQFEPPVTLAISTWDDAGPYREMDIEIGRWGESSGKNAQYVVQPFYVPANVVRFTAPGGPLAYAFAWEPGRVEFTTARPSLRGGKSDIVAAHVFTSGVPLPESETVRLNLYVFDDKRTRMQNEVEVIFEKFEYLP